MSPNAQHRRRRLRSGCRRRSAELLEDRGQRPDLIVAFGTEAHGEPGRGDRRLAQPGQRRADNPQQPGAPGSAGRRPSARLAVAMMAIRSIWCRRPVPAASAARRALDGLVQLGECPFDELEPALALFGARAARSDGSGFPARSDWTSGSAHVLVPRGRERRDLVDEGGQLWVVAGEFGQSSRGTRPNPAPRPRTRPMRAARA